jgi:hypothetical protein
MRRFVRMNAPAALFIANNVFYKITANIRQEYFRYQCYNQYYSVAVAEGIGSFPGK